MTLTADASVVIKWFVKEQGFDGPACSDALGGLQGTQGGPARQRALRLAGRSVNNTRSAVSTWRGYRRCIAMPSQ